MRKFLSFFAAILFAGSMMATDVAVTIYASSGDYYAKTHNWVSGSNSGPAYDQVVLDENITANRIGTGNNGKYYSDWRFYTSGSTNGSFSIDAAEGYELQSVTFTFSVSNSGALYMGETKLTSKTAVQVSGRKAVFQCKNTNTSTNGQVRLTAISVTYQPAAPAAKYYIAGTMTNWAANMVEMTAGNEDTLSVKIALEADSLYEFKVVKILDKDTTWFGNAEAATMTYGNSTGWWLKGDKNVGLQTTKAADYEFIFEANENNMISVVIPEPAPAPVVYYAKYADAASEWNWHALTEKEGKWLTDTIVYYGGGMNIHSAQEGDGKYFGEIAGVAAKDTAYFAFNPTDSTLTATVTGKYVEPIVPTAKYYIAGTMTDWAAKMVEMTAGNEDTLSVKIALEADSLYEFKVVKILDKDTTWFGNAEAATMTYGNSTGWWLKGDKNVGLQTTKAADYEFIFKANANNEISVVIPEPAPAPVVYYAKYADAASEWNWHALTEKEGKWLTDTIVYYGGGMNIHSAQEGDGKYFGEIAGVATNDTAYFTFNPTDSTLTATVTGKYIAPIVPTAKYYIAGTMTDWAAKMVEMTAGNEDTLSVKIALEADSLYEFKVVKILDKDTTWFGNAEAATMTYGNSTGWWLTGSKNVGLQTTKADKYEFIFKANANNEISVVIPAPAPVIPAKYYITGDSALVTDAGAPGKAWNPDAIRVDQDTMVLNLKADQYYILKVTVNGTWEGENNVKGYNELTEKTPGLDDEGKDHNIGFKLNTAGAVKVIYNDSVFKLVGDFYVAPVPVPAKYYITGDSALVTDAGAPGKAWNPSAIRVDQDTMVLNLKADQYYILKVTVNGTWEGENNVKGYNELTEKTPGLDDVSADHNIGFKLNTAGAVKVIYNDSVFKLVGDFYVAPVPVTPKYYVAGNMNGWDASKNPAYQDTLVLSLTAGDYQMKVVDNNNWIGVEALTDTAMNLYNVEGNVAFTLAADGDVKVIYKSGELFKVEGAFVAPAIKLAGIKGWEAADHIALTPDADGKTAEVAVALDQWYYEFKLVLGANWLSRNGSGAGEDSLYTIKSDRNYVEGMKNNQDNLCLRPNVVPGNYTFTYDLMAGKLTVTFPEPIPADPTAAVKGSMNNWGDSIPFVLAQDKKSASLTANIKKGNYEFKMIINGEWRSNGYTYHRDFPGCAGITANVEANMVLQLDVDGDYTFTWTFENDSLGIVFPNKPIPVLENGYYLVGDKYDWTPAATRMFVENTSSAGEYILADITLAADDSLKVVKVEDDEIITWYPAGDNYIVDAAHAGVKTVYFRPDGQGGEGWFAGTIYIEANSGEGVENTNANTKATKSLNKGVLIIEKNGVRYNSLGQVIR